MEPGTQIGGYEIVGPLGSGGMGEVFLARDLRLGRKVAIKILSPQATDDETFLARFEREARVLASLNHPNIATLHALEQDGDRRFLVLERIEGETLSELLRERAPSMEEALSIARQVADALDVAHRSGIVHRDLKPGNVMVTETGLVKVLDFGIVKQLALGESPGSELGEILTEEAGTVPAALTSTGSLLGTVPYMSPEQVRGESVDERADVWAFGCLLFELLTGVRAFERETPADTLAAILEVEPRWASLPPGVPEPVQLLLRRCLEKKKVRRPANMGEVARALPPSPDVSWDTHPGRGLGKRGRGRLLIGGGVVAAVVVIALAWIGLAPGHGPEDEATPPASEPAVSSIAVLPLRNLTGDPDQVYFADGMTEALINALTKISALRVISGTSVMPYRGTDKGVGQIAAELDVDAVVEGSVQRSGDQVLVRAQLVRAEPERTLMSNDFQRRIENILGLQGELARAIASEIRVTVTPTEAARLTTDATVDPRAYEAYLKGRHASRLQLAARLAEARAFLEEALDIDPGYAQAWVGLAEVYIAAGHFGTPPHQSFPLAIEAARRALELDPDSGTAHAALADASYHYEWDWAGAEEAFLDALDLNPGNAIAHSWYSGLLVALARFEEANAEIAIAQRLDPLLPAAHWLAARWHGYARQPEEARIDCERALEIDETEIMWYCLGSAYLGLGRAEDALDAMQRAQAAPGPASYATAGLVLANAALGDEPAARAALADLEAMRAERYIAGYQLALAHAALGQNSRALDWLEQAAEDRDAMLIWMAVEPVFERLHAEPRFQALAERMGLTPYSPAR